MPTPEPTDAGRYAYEGLDRVLHEKARLGILTCLATHPHGQRFNELRELCALTDGNLNRHLDVLHKAELVEIWKSSENGRRQTLVRLTARGRKRFLNYLAELEKLIRDASPRHPCAASAPAPRPPTGRSTGTSRRFLATMSPRRSSNRNQASRREA